MSRSACLVLATAISRESTQNLLSTRVYFHNPSPSPCPRPYSLSLFPDGLHSDPTYPFPRLALNYVTQAGYIASGQFVSRVVLRFPTDVGPIVMRYPSILAQSLRRKCCQLSQKFHWHHELLNCLYLPTRIFDILHIISVVLFLIVS